MVYKETDQVEIGYNEDISATYMIFKTSVNEKDFLQCHQYLIDMLNTRRYTTGKHLVDTSQLKVITGTAQNWVANNVLTLIHSLGRKEKVCLAVILSSNAFAEFAVKNITNETSDISHSKFFNNILDAKKWLAQEELQEA